MLMRADHGSTAQKLLAACEQVLNESGTFDEVSVRRIAGRADVAVSSISYHFGSLEELITAVAERVYLRLNAERLSLLNRAVERLAPAEPDLEEVIAALVGPSVRWSLDPHSSYRVLSHFTAMAQRSADPEQFSCVVESVEHHRVFIAQLQKLAPWLDEVDIGWRVNCALGIRSQVTRSRPRSEILTNHRIDFLDPEIVIQRIVEVVTPMFRRMTVE